MSLDNIQMSSFLLQNLYNKSLVDLEPIQAIQESLQAANIKFLGKNEKHIIIISDEDDSPGVENDSLSFLIKMMSACKINLNDVALINVHSQASINYAAIEVQLKPSTIIFFGIEPADLSYPLQFPHYQLQRYNSQVYLSAPSLDMLKTNKEEKTKLWQCLQKLFLVV